MLKQDPLDAKQHSMTFMRKINVPEKIDQKLFDARLSSTTFVLLAAEFSEGCPR